MNAWIAVSVIAVGLIVAIAWQTRHYCGCPNPDSVPVGCDDAGNPKFCCRKCGKQC